MARIRPIYNNFTNGELSPDTFGRTNSPQYNSGCKVLNNFLPDRRGGVFTRSPAMYLGSPIGQGIVNFLPFIVSRDDAYIVEAGENYFRFWRDGQIVGPTAGIVTPYGLNEIFDLQIAQANDVMYIVCDTKKPRKLSRLTPTTFQLDTPAFTPTPGTPAMPEWIAAPDDDPSGQPRTVCFYQQRLVFGGRASEPQTLWMSRAGDFENFETGGTSPDDDPLTLVIAAYTQELIQWLAPSRSLFVGTTGNEQRLLVNGALAPSNLPDISRQSSYGSRYIQPAFIGTQTIFVQASGIQLRNYDLNLTANVEFYDSIDLSFLADHLTEEGINQIAYQQIPESILWIVTDTGKLISMTYDPSLRGTGYEGIGWAAHDIDGTVETIAVIPRPTRDEVWVCINRPTSGRYIGRLDDDAYLFDSSFVKEEATEFNTMDGLTSLANETVGVVLDGAVFPDQVVSASGELTFPVNTRFAQVGIRYTPTLETMPPAFNLREGTTIARKKWWNELYVKVLESFPPLINGVRPPTRTPSTPMGNREPFMTGDIGVTVLGKGTEGTVKIEQDLPFKTRILSIHGNLEVGNE